jgi:hypothetical protein
MAHETHHHSSDNQPRTAISSSFWFVLILAGLFIAAVNFVRSSSSGHDDHGTGHGQHETMEATSSQTLEGETGLGKPADQATTQHFGDTAHNTTQHQGQH